MVKRNVMIGDLGGSVLMVSDTLHERNGDYVEVARIFKGTGEINWTLKSGLDVQNENLNNHPNFVGTVREVVERFSDLEKNKLRGEK